jgi:hypothetical protein
MKGSSRRVVIGVALCAVATACTESRRAEQPSTPTGAAAIATPFPASTTPGPSIPIAPPAPAPTTPPVPSAPAALPLTRAQALEPNAATVTLAPGEEAVVDAGARFQLEIGRALRDARLVLVDAADAHVTGSEVREVGTTTVLELTPEPPLRPGSRYLLRVEGIDGGPIRGGDGVAYEPVTVPLIVAGTPPPPEPERKPARRKRRR